MDDYCCQADWVCVDCLFFMANGDLPEESLFDAVLPFENGLHLLGGHVAAACEYLAKARRNAARFQLVLLLKSQAFLELADRAEVGLDSQVTE